MNENKFFTELEKKLREFEIFPKMISIYKELKESLQEYQVIDFYIKEKVTNHTDIGSQLEVLFFDKKSIHYLILNAASTSHHILPIKFIGLVSFDTINDKKDIGQTPNKNEIKLRIVANGFNKYEICVLSDTSEFTELHRFKCNLLNQISS